MTQSEPVTRWLAVPPGATLMIIDYQAAQMTPLVLTRLNHKNIEFKCACGDPACTRVAIFKAKWRGYHAGESASDGKKGAQTLGSEG